MISQLLPRLMSGKITAEEYAQLKSGINTFSDKQLQSTFQSLWQEQGLVEPMPTFEKMNILAALNRKTYKKSVQLRLIKTIAAVIVPILLMWGTYQYTSDPFATRQPVVVMADAGQKTHLRLSDGTEVWVNSKSSITYASDFGAKNRIVKLNGEAYFEVKKDEKCKFIVETEGVNIVVHGTRFNVSARPECSTIEVSLMEGSVAVENKNHVQLAILSPNHTIQINKENMRWSLLSQNAENNSLWRLNKCRFERATAAEVFQKLEYWYGVKINVENINTKYKYSFTIKNESIRELLELINELTPLYYKIDGEEVHVRYK